MQQVRTGGSHKLAETCSARESGKHGPNNVSQRSQTCMPAMTNDDSVLNNYIVMKIKDKTVQCLVDTGGVSTVISHTFALKLGLDIRMLCFRLMELH